VYTHSLIDMCEMLLPQFKKCQTEPIRAVNIKKIDIARLCE
jgi:hypothetical protein